MDYFQEEKASREEDKRYSSLQWIRWMMDVVWGELHATWRNQGSRHTRTLGNAFQIRYFGAVWSSLKRKACNFTKRGHMQSFLYKLYQKVRLTPRVPRVVPKSNSQYGQQDPQNRKIILGTIKRFEKLRWNQYQHRGIQSIWSTSFCSRAAGYNTREQGRCLCSNVCCSLRGVATSE